ncbi:GFA family protein [Ruegeria sp. HKCCD8929]|uniref:GFA family protein n=1 Tax=Ruegeria sp. HKCCD8929 TaxID=2683006 RepID=UPI001C2C20F1|nr:GFA family protein [Ruegeria sp. HKCCD8929]
MTPMLFRKVLEMKGKLSGGCACGSVRYASDADIEFSFNCHCRKCQRATGSGHASAFALPLDSVKIEGDIKEYKGVSDSGAATYSGFCPHCGSPLMSRTERFPERRYFHAATLDDPSMFDVGFSVFQEEAQPWDPPHEDAGAAPE